MESAIKFTFMTSPSNPLISILLSVHNGGATLQKAVQSIAEQTYTNLELIAVNDASTDNSASILSDWKASSSIPTTIITHEHTKGLTVSLNEALAIAKGTYIARLDADDQWVSEKTAKQVSFLTTHPDCGIVGSWYMNVGLSGKRTVKLPGTDGAIKKEMFWKNPFGHSCVMIRKTVLSQARGYDQTIRFGQDRDLWFRLLPLTAMANIPEVLCMRTVGSISTTKRREQILQQCKTVHKYARLYKASPLVYLSLVEPLLLYAIPDNVRLFMRSTYDRLFTH